MKQEANVISQETFSCFCRLITELKFFYRIVMLNNHTPTKFKSGTYFELIQDLGPIPHGVYRLRDCDSRRADFFPGKKVGFSIIGNWQSKVKAIPDSIGWKIKTSQSDFIGRYYELLEKYKSNCLDSEESDVFTMCFVDPSICSEMN